MRRLKDHERKKYDGRDLVAFVLALGLAVAVNVVAIGIAVVALQNSGNVFPVTGGGGLPENLTQILTLVFGGIIGVLGSYIGAGEKKPSDTPPTEESP
jgi:hypothetical protein